MSVSIQAENLVLDVPVYLQHQSQAKGWAGMFLGAAFDPPIRQTARLLDNISFNVQEGDRLAILGRNGAGKSTLLRVLNRVYQPTHGNLVIRGSCQALLNMGLGFSGEATIRENIYLRGIAMGLKTSFLRQQIDPILDFSGLRDKTNHRLSTLSSGQRMRLGFAISTSVQHDIILMDEWVGAGDAEFMARAKERMQSRVGGSKIVVLASHSVPLLRDLCNKGIVLDRGKLVYKGDIVSSLKAYHELLAALRDGNEPATQRSDEDRAAMIYGYAEELLVHGGRVEISGWLAGADGHIPRGLAIICGNLRHLPVEVDFHKRPDVQKHMGLSTDECGFRAQFEVNSIHSADQLGPDFQVLAGPLPESAHAPLRLAQPVQSAVGGR